MPKHRTSKRAHADARGARARGCLLAGLTAIYVARPLLPSETILTVNGEGLPFVMLLLAVCIGWLITAVWRGEWNVRLGWVDVGWCVLVGALAAGTAWAARDGDGRGAINMFWEWVALAGGFFLVRQLVATAREARALAAVMIGLAVATSGIGLFQYFVTRPADRERYKIDPEGVVLEAGIVAPAGSPMRILFENRLLATEPTATFSLANSFAGFLAPWLVVTMGMIASGIASPIASGEQQSKTANRTELRNNVWTTREWLLVACPAVCGLPLAACLVLTKSRSAWIAAATGLAAIAVWTVYSLRREKTQRLGRKALLSGAVAAIALAMLIAGATLTGALDRQVFTEATKSLGYRWQYWQGACSIVRDHFWLGCGLTNFQDYYTQYKLPEASEVVADPHNFVFEIWATAGTAALIGLVLVAAGAAWDMFASWRSRHAGVLGTQPQAASKSAVKSDTDVAAYVLAGGALGFVAAYLIGEMGTVPLGDAAFMGGLALASIAVAGLRTWVESGRLAAPLPWLGASVMVVNLLAAGGICFPGVAGSLWLLCALGFTLGDHRPPRRLSRRAAGLFLICALAVAAVCSLTAYLPVMRSRMNLLRAQAPGLGAAEIESLLVGAAQADPRADQPRRQLAELTFARWTERPLPVLFQRWRSFQDEVLRLRPMSSAAWQQAADSFFEAYRRLNKTEWLDEAVRHYRRAVELYPNQATLRGRLAVALDASGAARAAAAEADHALRLDHLTPHLDQKLPDELRGELLRITAAGNYTDDGSE
jgi:O-antigen ligase